ncbi:hypothetical protein AB6A40_006613 [Gnathostoma spinigerum]|uniref:Uncharacterized protein n=1 Tax=Gnathostoma spinigerum TaxID=75299 RepID=A0ABD6EIW1_9BILA
MDVVSNQESLSHTECSKEKVPKCKYLFIFLDHSGNCNRNSILGFQRFSSESGELLADIRPQKHVKRRRPGPSLSVAFVYPIRNGW